MSKFQNVLKNKKKEVRDDANIEKKEYGHSKQLRLGSQKPCHTCAVLRFGSVATSQNCFVCLTA